MNSGFSIKEKEKIPPAIATIAARKTFPLFRARISLLSAQLITGTNSCQQNARIANGVFPSLKRRGGAAKREPDRASLKKSGAGVVNSAKRFGRTSIEASPYRARASRHPACALASLGASTPPFQGGENSGITTRREVSSHPHQEPALYKAGLV